MSLLQAAYVAAGHEEGKENSGAQAPNGTAVVTGRPSPSKSVPTTWEAFCKTTLSSTAALAVLRVSSR